MAEVPPHLLERSRSRRAALSGGSPDAAPSPAPAAASPGSANVPAVVAATPAKTAAPAPVAAAPVEVAVPKPPKGSMFAKMGSAFFLTVTPIWALFMFNAFTTEKSKVLSAEAQGAALYAANCASCHLAGGEGSDKGGVGRPLWNGQAELTFPDPLAQVAYVANGSCAAGTPYGDPKRPGGQHKAKGGMPNFNGVLTDDQILYVVAYERSRLSGKDYPADVYAKVGEEANEERASHSVGHGGVPQTIEELGFKLDTETVCG